MDVLVILCLLGDPALPAVSVKHTGGFQVDIQELLANLHNPKCAVHIITNTSEYCPSLYEEKEAYTIHRIRFQEEWLDNQNLLMENFEQIQSDFFKILEEISGEHLLIHSFYWLSGILAMEAKRCRQIDYVHSVVSLAVGKTLGGDTPHFSRQFEYEKKFLQAASAVFSITQAEYEHLREYYGIDPEKVIVVGRGAHPAFLHPCHQMDGLPGEILPSASDIPPVELMKYRWWSQGAYTYVGRLQTIKGLQYILMAWSQLYQEHGSATPPLWICGGTPENIRDFRSQLQPYVDMALLEKYEECQKVVWWGYLDPAGLSTLFLKTRVLVTHSQYEAGGRVLLEALAASVPVIATPYGFAKTLLQNGVNGFLVDYGRVEELRRTMEYFMLAEDELLKMKKQARSTYLSKQREWNCYQKHFETYRRMGLDSF